MKFDPTPLWRYGALVIVRINGVPLYLMRVKLFFDISRANAPS